MSNDVHLYHRARPTDKHEALAANARRPVVRNSDRFKDAITEASHDTHNDFAFGSLSPRSGNKYIIKGYEELPDSPEHAQRDTNESDNNISSCSTLDIVNKVDGSSFQLLETKLNELNKKIESSELKCADLKRKLDESNAEKDICLRRIEVLSAAHECRITEMHCVIAELTKKLRAKQDNTILEEQEPDDCGNSEISYQEGSICNSDIPTTNPEIEHHTNPSNDSYKTNPRINEDSASGIGIDADDINSLQMRNSDHFKIYERDNVNKLQVETLQEEILELKAQIAFLQSQIHEGTKKELMYSQNLQDRNDIIFYVSKELEDNLNLEEADRSLNYVDKTHENEQLKLTEQCHALCTPKKVLPKLAERIKLNCVSKMIAENMPETKYLKNIDNLEEVRCENNQAISPSVQHEISNLQFQLEQLKMQNMMLCMNLDECKENCNHLYLLCGKYESNAVAMQIALNCSDRAIEAYDVMLALLESKLALIYDKSTTADESRKAVENVARHLLDRLESEINVCENSLGPWQNTYFGISKKSTAPWTSDDEKRLRYHVSKLKGTRATVQNTIVNLQSPFSGFHEKSRIAFAVNEDKENIDSTERALNILMYEVIQLREDNLILLKRIEEHEREAYDYMDKNNSLLTDSLKETHLQHIQTAAEQQKIFESFVDNNNGKQELKHDINATMSNLHKTKEIETLLQHNNLKYQGRIRKLEKIISDLKFELTLQSSQLEKSQENPVFNTDQAISRRCGNVPETTL